MITIVWGLMGADTGSVYLPLSLPEDTAEIPSLELKLFDTVMDNREASPASAMPDQPSPRSPGLGDPIRRLLLGGNLMVRVGVVVLRFGRQPHR